jgi:ATP-dependent RNA helicase DeaD
MIRVTAEELTISLVSQKYYLVKNQDKDAACVRLLEFYRPALCLIFCNTKKKVDELTEYLKKQDYQAEGLHGDMVQSQRDAAMGRFRNGSTGILIATDVAARGIDVENVEAVINYDLPQENEYYTHRIGRTGRARRHGVAITLMSFQESVRMDEILRYLQGDKPEKLEFDDMGILRHADGEPFFENI